MFSEKEMTYIYAEFKKIYLSKEFKYLSEEYQEVTKSILEKGRRYFTENNKGHWTY